MSYWWKWSNTPAHWQRKMVLILPHHKSSENAMKSLQNTTTLSSCDTLLQPGKHTLRLYWTNVPVNIFKSHCTKATRWTIRDMKSSLKMKATLKELMEWRHKTGILKCWVFKPIVTSSQYNIHCKLDYTIEVNVKLKSGWN